MSPPIFIFPTFPNDIREEKGKKAGSETENADT